MNTIYKYLLLFIFISPFIQQDLGAFPRSGSRSENSGSVHYTSDQKIDRRNFGRENYPSWKANGGFQNENLNNQYWNNPGGTTIRIR